MKVLDTSVLDDLRDTALSRPRRRMNHNFHEDHDQPIMRMFNALAADTYVRPHRHPENWELFVLIRGRVLLLTFSEDGRVDQRHDLRQGGVHAVEIPAGTWHSVASMSDDTAILEVKAGPFVPTREEDFAPWAPAEGTEHVAGFLDWMKGSDMGAFQAPVRTPQT